MIILSACDLKYKKFMDCLVRSVLTNTRHEIYVHYLNKKCPEDPRYEVEYFSSYRIDLLSAHHNGSGANLLWLDSDSIVRKPLDQLDQWLQEVDSCCVHTPEMGIPGSMNHWLVSTVGVSGSPRGRELINAWKLELTKLQRSGWEPGVMTIQQAYINAIPGFNVKDIGYEYSDKFFRPDTFIWEAQGPRKYDDPAWLEEMGKYKEK